MLIYREKHKFHLLHRMLLIIMYVAECVKLCRSIARHRTRGGLFRFSNKKAPIECMVKYLNRQTNSRL